MNSLPPWCMSLLAVLTLWASHSALCFSAEPPLNSGTFRVSGAALKPGEYPWQAGARLHDATVAGRVRADAWFLGAALLREEAREPQLRLKAGVLFDLRVNQVHALATRNARLQQLLERLEQQAEQLPVTGRVRAQLDPFQLLILKNNPLLHPRDHLIYPLRPDQIRVMGAVMADCELTFDPKLALKHYLRQCPRHATADRDEVYVIQPDGYIQTVGIAHWNQQQINLAVGAIIYRPLKSSALSPDTPDMNRDIAAFLATQHSLGGRFYE
jgi:hypothetical protein